MAHAPYTLNGCSADEKIRDFAKRTMADDLERMEAVPGNLYNFHPGSHVKQGVEVGITYIAEMLNEILKSGASHHGAPGDHGGKGQRGRKKLLRNFGKFLTELNFLIRWVYVWIPVMYGMPDMTS